MVRGCFKKSLGVPGTLEGFVLQRSFFELMNQKPFFQPKNGAFLKSLSNGRFLETSGKISDTKPREEEVLQTLPQELKTMKLHFRQKDSENSTLSQTNSSHLKMDPLGKGETSTNHQFWVSILAC